MQLPEIKLKDEPAHSTKCKGSLVEHVDFVVIVRKGVEIRNMQRWRKPTPRIKVIKITRKGNGKKKLQLDQFVGLVLGYHDSLVQQMVQLAI